MEYQQSATEGIVENYDEGRPHNHFRGTVISDVFSYQIAVNFTGIDDIGQLLPEFQDADEICQGIVKCSGFLAELGKSLLFLQCLYCSLYYSSA